MCVCVCALHNLHGASQQNLVTQAFPLVAFFGAISVNLLLIGHKILS